MIRTISMRLGAPMTADNRKTKFSDRLEVDKGAHGIYQRAMTTDASISNVLRKLDRGATRLQVHLLACAWLISIVSVMVFIIAIAVSPPVHANS
jgi:hypothetical protein